MVHAAVVLYDCVSLIHREMARTVSRKVAQLHERPSYEPQSRFDPNPQRSLLMFIAILIGLSSVGIDVTVLGVFGGAVGVGLGFGLQKITSNYISGFIILLDRSVKSVT